MLRPEDFETFENFEPVGKEQVDFINYERGTISDIHRYEGENLDEIIEEVDNSEIVGEVGGFDGAVVHGSSVNHDHQLIDLRRVLVDPDKAYAGVVTNENMSKGDKNQIERGLELLGPADYNISTEESLEDPKDIVALYQPQTTFYFENHSVES